MCVGAPGEARKCAVCKNERFCPNYSRNEPYVHPPSTGDAVPSMVLPFYRPVNRLAKPPGKRVYRAVSSLFEPWYI